MNTLAVLFGFFVVSDATKYHSTNRCASRDPPENGYVNPDESWYSAGDQITFKCNEGYSIYGVHEDLCLNGGTWKLRKTPHCKPFCYARKPPDNGKVSHSYPQKFSAVGENISFTCNSGFELEGRRDDECVGINRWLVNITPRCLPVPRCRSRYVPRNGHLYPNEEYFITGDRIRFECDHDYHLVGFQYDYCQIDGTWKINVEPYCTPFCNPLKTPESGIMTPQKKFYNVGDVVLFSCHLQYKLVGVYKSKCMLGDMWSNDVIPKCIQFVCLPRPPPLHGYVKPHQVYYKRYSNITYSCKNDYKLVGTKKDECIFPGKWRVKKTPKCVQMASCPERSPPENGLLKPTQKKYFPFENVTFSCDKGYKLNGNNMDTCLSTGKWAISQTPSCVKPCYIEEVNAYILYTPKHEYYLPRELVKFECMKPYHLLGNEKLECRDDGTWFTNSTFPDCELRCNEPIVKNGGVVNPITYYRPGKWIKYFCNKGYSSKIKYGQCLESGRKWSQIAKCKRTTKYYTGE